jgi:transketolase
MKAEFASDKPKFATRKTSGIVLEKLFPVVPEFIGGSADLTGSNLTKTSEMSAFSANDYSGNYLYYGVREHGMAAIMNGMALHGGVIPYGGTFMSFTDYCRPSIRLAALMKIRSVFVMTHDSIGLGEDGPTHQPVEHVSSLRAMPNLLVFRPCDGVETAECWELALNKLDGPSVLSLTRQGVPTVRDDTDDNLCAKGAYILDDCDGEPQVTLFASGSEVELALEAKQKLSSESIDVRVVSVPCMELFFEQDGEYQQSLVCNSSIKIAVEAGVRQGWGRFIGAHGSFVGMDSFGESAPSDDLYDHFNITSEHIVNTVKNRLNKD